MADDHKQLLHELLKENQEPFRLKNYIAERRSQLKKPSHKTTLQIKNQKPPVEITKPRSICKHACFLSFHNSPDVRKSPFSDLPSPLKSPCSKSPRGRDAVFLHVPSRTAAMLVESAMRIHKTNKSPLKNRGFGLFGSLLKRLKDRSKNKRRAFGDKELQFSSNRPEEIEGEIDENVRISWEASTSTCEEMVDHGDLIYEEMRFCVSPFRFSLRRSPSCSGSAASRTPEFCSPVASPRLAVSQEKENYKAKSPKNTNGEEGDDEEKEYCSPVSILDPLFEDNDGHDESEDEVEEDDYELDRSYANVQRARQQLLSRLRRFERLAELDPVELERKMLDSSDEESDQEIETEPDQDDTFLMSINPKNRVAQPVVEEKGKIALKSNRKVVFGRIFNRSGSWKEVEFDTVDTMIDRDSKMDFHVWKGFSEPVGDIVAELELDLFDTVVEELSRELCCMDHTCT